ncbi:MAG: PEGA domain-containing protein [Myxococcota bacterium]|nr:PEGA domain-containing protein [Myxococcota bacterium]
MCADLIARPRARGATCLLVLSVLLALLAPGAAHADDREEARREFAAGQAADRRKEYQAAIEHYMRANDLVPHPFAMFNIATDFERLGKLREAASWYERYLDTASATEADREKVNRQLIELRNRAAPLTVSSRPDGARVVINGIPSGSTPYKGQLKGGMYRVAVEKDGRREWKEVTIEYGEPVTVELVLPGAPTQVTPEAAVRRPAPAPGAAVGTLAVTGDPPGALVTVDGMAVGVVPARLAIEPGEHTVRVTSYGHTPFEAAVVITPNTETPVHAQLGKPLGTMGTHPRIDVGYLLGGGGGADATGSGALYLFEAGIRVVQYDASIRVGRIADVAAVDVLVRWAFSKGKVAPYLGAGYSYVTSGFGYVLLGGLRWDISRGEKLGISLMAESGFRYYSGTSTATDDTSSTTSGSIVPIMASLLIVYR